MAALLKQRALDRLREQVRDADGLPVMSPAALKLACLEHDGYEGPALNDKLFLHFKGYREVANLEPYVNLKTLFLESNGLRAIDGLAHLTQMRSLYLQQNVIDRIENLDMMRDLKTLNLSLCKKLKLLPASKSRHSTLCYFLILEI